MNKNIQKTVINNFVNYVKINIIDLAKKELDNSEKKKKLDKAVYVYLETLVSGVRINLFVKFIIEKFIIQNIPVITQAIYDLLKSKIESDDNNANNSQASVDNNSDEV